MPRYTITLILVILATSAFLAIRKLVDRRTEKNNDTEVVRDDEEYLGSWASKSADGFIKMRLHRDGKLTYTYVSGTEGDTAIIHGKYQYVHGAPNEISYFPRLYTFNEKGDTIFNYYVRYLTRYTMTIDNVDKMILSPNSVYDTIGYTFYRVKK